MLRKLGKVAGKEPFRVVTDMAQAGVLHHDDASVESLAARIGEKVDWTRVD